MLECLIAVCLVLPNREKNSHIFSIYNLVLPTPKYKPSERPDKLVLFGQDFYPAGYYDDSFAINSKYKKLPTKNDMNGIKYLSHETNINCDWSIFYINTDLIINQSSILEIKSLFKETSVAVDIELIYGLDNKEHSTKRHRINTKSHFVSSESIKISDIYDHSSSLHLLAIKFILHHRGRYTEFCITELSITNPTDRS
jgi:hypothetical protein